MKTFLSVEDTKTADDGTIAKLQDGTTYVIKHGTLYKQKTSTKHLSPSKKARKAARASLLRQQQKPSNKHSEAL